MCVCVCDNANDWQAQKINRPKIKIKIDIFYGFNGCCVSFVRKWKSCLTHNIKIQPTSADVPSNSIRSIGKAGTPRTGQCDIYLNTNYNPTTVFKLLCHIPTCLFICIYQHIVFFCILL